MYFFFTAKHTNTIIREMVVMKWWKSILKRCKQTKIITNWFQVLSQNPKDNNMSEEENKCCKNNIRAQKVK